MSRTIGLDLVSVADVRDALCANGHAYLERTYSEREVSECRRDGRVDADQLAMRFAAKEAVMKILGPEGHDAVPWHTIEIQGASVSLEDGAAALASRRRVQTVSVSFSRAGDQVAAVAMAEIGAEA